MESAGVFVICSLMFAHVGDVSCVTATDMRTHLSTIIPTTGVNLYYAYVRPINDQSQALAVTVDLHLIGINSFDNGEQKLTTTAYLDIQWTDEVIATKWTSTDITTVYLPQDDVWRPDIALENGFESLKGLGNSFLYIKMDKTGAATWKPYQIFESACEVDITFFPFDKAFCDLKFVIWSNTIDLVKLTQGTVGLNTELYETNSEWDVLKTTATNFETTTTSGVVFTIEMKRKPLHYLINIFIPVIFLGIIDVFVFILPSGSGEKTGFAVTAFLSFAVFLTIISTELPQNSEKVSAFSAYLFIMTMISTIIVIVTLIQLRLFNRDEDQPISAAWHSFVKCIRKAQCACCIGSGHVAVDEKKRKLAEIVTWQAIADSMDFLFFWVFLIVIVVFTVSIITVSIFGAASS